MGETTTRLGKTEYGWGFDWQSWLAGCGGVVRDEHGNWLVGCSRSIGITSSFVAELWSLRDGLLLCYNLNISSLCC